MVSPTFFRTASFFPNPRFPMRTSLRISLPLALLASCSPSELVGIHVTLAKDGSATVTTRALLEAPAAGAVEVTAKGVSWTARAALLHSRGQAKSVADLDLADGSIKFQPRLDSEPASLRVTIQRGPNASWIKTLVPSRDARRSVANVYDPSGKTREVGDVIRLEVAGTTEANGSSVLPVARGVSADRDGARAILLIPAQTAAEAGEPLVWDITWK